MSIFKNLKSIDKSKLAAGIAGLVAASAAAENSKLRSENKQLQEEMDRMREREREHYEAAEEQLRQENASHALTVYLEKEQTFMDGIIELNENAVFYFSILTEQDPEKAIIEYLNMQDPWGNFSWVAKSEPEKYSSAYDDYIRMRQDIDAKMESIPDYANARELHSNIKAFEESTTRFNSLMKSKPINTFSSELPPGLQQDILTAVGFFAASVASFIIIPVFKIEAIDLLPFIPLAVACFYGIMLIPGISRYRNRVKKAKDEYNKAMWKWTEDVRTTQTRIDDLLVNIEANMSKTPQNIIDGLGILPILKECRSTLLNQ